MQNVKIISALMFGLIGFWAFSLVSDGEATHILINQTAAIPTDDGYVLSFTLENQGAADRLTGATSTEGEVTLSSAIDIPAGITLFTEEDAWLRVTTDTEADIDVRLQFEQAGTVSAIIRAPDS